MYAMRTLDQCIEHVTNCCEVDYMTGQGMDLAEAFCQVHGIECTDAIREVFNKCSNRAG